MKKHYLIACLFFWAGFVSTTHAATIDVTVKNVNGSTVSGAEVKLYNSSWGLLSTKSTESSGYVRFALLDYGTYHYEVRYSGAGGTEFWGSDENISLQQPLIARTFTRYWPYKSAESLPSDPLVGKTVTIEVTVKNNVALSRNTKVELWVDRSKSSSWDYHSTSAPQTISGSGGTKKFAFSITPSSSSKYYWKMNVLTYNDGSGDYILTDSSAWEEAFDPFYSDVDIYVKDIHGSYFQGAEVEIDGDTDTTDSSGKADLSVSYGTHWYEVYYEGAGGREFWCSDQITVDGSAESETIQRNWPYKSGQSLPSLDPKVGDTVAISITAKNNLTYSRNVKVELWVDRDQNSSWDYYKTSTAQSVSGYGGTKTFSFNDITPTGSGQYYWRANILSYNDGAGDYLLTDSLAWADAFDVPEPPQPLSLNGRIAYHSYSDYMASPVDSTDGHVFVYYVGSDTLTKVTDGLLIENAMNPHFSHDGSRITFMAIPVGSARNRNSLEVYVLDLASSSLVRLTDNSVPDEDPKFSPAGDLIVWKRQGQIWRMSSDGTSQTQLTSTSDEKSGPNYSPDGSKIVYWSDGGSSADVWWMSNSGAGSSEIVGNASIQDYYPIYRDSGNILYSRWESVDDPHDKIYNYNIGSASSTRLAVNVTGVEDADAAPVDETYLVLSSTRSGGDGSYDVYVARYDNGVAYTLSAANSFHKDLGPCYSEYTYARSAILLMPGDGSDLEAGQSVLLTAQLWSDGAAWSGASPAITFSGPTTVEYTGLKDDGTQGDITPGDGVYSKTVTLPTTTGSYSVTASVESVEPGVTRHVTSSAFTVSVNAPDQYTLTVNSGSGDGSYTNGTVVPISANSPPSGQTFDVWTGDTAYVANVNSSSTTVTMPSGPVTVTATYKTLSFDYYTLTVNSGSGDGSYTNGQMVTITADAPSSNQVFSAWTGDTAYVADANSACTSVIMPAQSISVTATYREAVVSTEFYEDWETGVIDTGKWKIWGSPVPTIVSGGNSIGNYALTSNGDGWHESGVTSFQSFDVRPGLVVKAKMFIQAPGTDVWSKRSWQGVQLSSRPPAEWNDSQGAGDEAIGPYIGIRGNTPLETGLGISLPEGGTNFSSAAWVDRWTEVGFEFNEDGSVTYLIDGDVLYITSAGWIDYNTVATAYLVCGGRSEGSTVINLHDNISVVDSLGADSDGDGQADANENIAGTDPNNPASHFSVTNYGSLGSHVLEWPCVSGRVYSVWWATNLLSSFQCIESNIPWTQMPYTDAVHNSEDKGFYKIGVQLGE